MMRITLTLTLTLMLAPVAGAAESLVALRSLPARTVIAPGDVALVDAEIPDALTRADAAIGKETRVAIYAGRAVRAADLGAPALVERNASVILLYRNLGLSIQAEGRALARGAEGETVRVMNLASKVTVSGIVQSDGRILVGGDRRP
ncbi:flagellar basal body P-ring formation chaperone FlgA [Pseudogemmobacter sonorensis]|uniref:flagellar basal body P-ring formation chaperone FlgA n=1 Tax=Pseudogemmobacter sonorensis TaxID=2989681 RepID=UPI0036B80198